MAGVSVQRSQNLLPVWRPNQRVSQKVRATHFLLANCAAVARCAGSIIGADSNSIPLFMFTVSFVICVSAVRFAMAPACHAVLTEKKLEINSEVGVK